MKNIYRTLYRFLPANLFKAIGRSSLVSPIKNFILKGDGDYRETSVDIRGFFGPYQVKFKYFASIYNAVRAEQNGVEHKLLKNSLKIIQKYRKNSEDNVVVDIGSNFGYLSMIWAKTIAKEGCVFAFEANKNVADTFLKTIEFNSANNIKLYNVAIGGRSKDIEMYVSPTSSNFNKIDGYQRTQKVKMQTLDNFFAISKLEKCDLIKIDVDGAEYDILNSSINVINKFRPICVVETNDDHRIIEFFQLNGYTIYDMNLSLYKKDNPIPVNIFCLFE